MSLQGQRLGHYRLLRLLGSGGMGEVYLAEGARIGQQVAIKVIRTVGIAYPESESANEAARLFEREAKAVQWASRTDPMAISGSPSVMETRSGASRVASDAKFVSRTRARVAQPRTALARDGSAQVGHYDTALCISENPSGRGTSSPR